jgi:hypothetical protein
MKDGHAVARSSDFIIYSVEAEFIGNVVAQFGPCMSIHVYTSLSYFDVPFQPLKCTQWLLGKPP